jgi:hypothetical protein
MGCGALLAKTMECRIDGRQPFASRQLVNRSPVVTGSGGAPQAAQQDPLGGFERCAIGLGEAAKGFAHQALLEGGEDGLDDGGLQKPGCLPEPQGTLPKAGVERPWLVLAMRIRSGRSAG